MQPCFHRPLQRQDDQEPRSLLISCEAQRDLVFARAREPLKQRNRQRGSPNRDFETPHRNRVCKELMKGARLPVLAASSKKRPRLFAGGEEFGVHEGRACLAAGQSAS